MSFSLLLQNLPLLVERPTDLALRQTEKTGYPLETPVAMTIVLSPSNTFWLLGWGSMSAFANKCCVIFTCNFYVYCIRSDFSVIFFSLPFKIRGRTPLYSSICKKKCHISLRLYRNVSIAITIPMNQQTTENTSYAIMASVYLYWMRSCISMTSCVTSPIASIVALSNHRHWQ